MRTIWKCEIPFEDHFVLELPLKAEILCVQCQNEVPNFWVLVPDSEFEKEKRVFAMYGTGHEITRPNLRYIGTFQGAGGRFVGHVFEMIQSLEAF